MIQQQKIKEMKYGLCYSHLPNEDVRPICVGNLKLAFKVP